jgi:RND family efflux transporter MFP subunit
MNVTLRTGITVMVVVGLGAGCIVAERHLEASPGPVNAATTDSRPRVELVPPQRVTVARRLQTNATLEAFEKADLFAKVSGYLSDVRADIGDHVKAGQVLALIDAPETEQELAEAKAQLETKQRALEVARWQIESGKADLALQELTFKRQGTLNKDQWVSNQALDEARAKNDTARANLGLAKANHDQSAAQVDMAAATVEKTKALLAYTNIVAPFDGVVTRRAVNRGDLVQVATTATRATPSAGSLFTVERIDTIRVFCDVPENDVPHLHIGDPAIVKPFGFDGKPFIGEVTRVSLHLDPKTRNMRTEIDLPNPDERLYPGMYAEVALEMNRRPNALTLPVAAVGSDGDGNFVYTIRDDRIARLGIKSGFADNGRIEVTAGLGEKTPVVAAVKDVPPPGTRIQPQIPVENR